jgi:hypothetical protein
MVMQTTQQDIGDLDRMIVIGTAQENEVETLPTEAVAAQKQIQDLRQLTLGL